MLALSDGRAEEASSDGDNGDLKMYSVSPIPFPKGIKGGYVELTNGIDKRGPPHFHLPVRLSGCDFGRLYMVVPAYG
jgi:hypothetical protein